MRGIATTLHLALLCGLAGCNLDLLHPAGPVAVQETRLLAETTLAMLVVVLPVIFMTIYFAWAYRATARHDRYDQNFDHSTLIELFVWGVPCVIVVILALMEWRSTIALDPFRPLPGTAPVLDVQVAALDWKWLFIYPDQHIATVNELVVPTGTDITFEITSSGAMNAFFIPRLGTQIYAMAGMRSEVHLLAKDAGTYSGLSANFSGEGFPHMNFKTDAVSPAQFTQWVHNMQTLPGTMDQAAYARLKQPGTMRGPQFFGHAAPDLFNMIVNMGNGMQTPPVTNMPPARQ